MSGIAATIALIDRMTEEAKRRHRGHKLWLLDERQSARYQDWQARCSKIIEQHEPDGYYTAYLNGTAAELPELPVDLVHALQLTEAPKIPITASTSQACEIYAHFAGLNGA